jgi:choice-of-anchor C domain-containing protein
MDCRGGQHPENVIPITQTLMDMYGRGADITPCYIPVPPSPNFTAAPSSGKPPLTVTFTNTSIGDITSWLWDFGDGNTSSEQGPTHTYNNPASYTVKLTATGPGGQVTETKPNFITVIAPPEAKLIQNGSFEVGPVIPTSPGFVTLNSGDTFIQGWTVGGNGVDLNGNYWQPSDGKNSVDLSALAAGSLAQTFPTIPGARYNLRFDLAGNPAGTPAVKTLRVMVAEVSQDFSFDTTGKSLTNMGWVTKSLSFKATSPATTLTFESLDNTFYGPVIDNVRVFKRTLLPLDLLLLY